MKGLKNFSLEGIFRHQRYVYVPALIPPGAVGTLYQYALSAARTGGASLNDQQVPNTPACYGDPVMERLLAALRPTIESAIGLELYPTYSYFRVYKSGDILPKHKDRPACEISVTVSLGYDAETTWPIWLQSGDSEVEIALEPGDALLYRGTEVTHWRSAFEGRCAAQVFLHYVDKNGQYREWRFDGRAGLSAPSAAQTLAKG
jgi:hypothetical protein